MLRPKDRVLSDGACKTIQIHVGACKTIQIHVVAFADSKLTPLPLWIPFDR